MDYIKPFLIGGGTIAATKLFTKIVNPIFGSLISSTPTGLIGSFFLDNDKEKRRYYKGYAVSDSILAVTIISLFFLTKYTRVIPINYLSFGGLLFWFLISFMSIYITKDRFPNKIG